MLVEELDNKLDTGLFNKDDSDKIKLLLEAINDWPDPVESLEAFLIKLQIDCGSEEVTLKTINSALKQIDFSKDAWKMESYSQIIELLTLCKTSLNDFLKYLKI